MVALAIGPKVLHTATDTTTDRTEDPPGEQALETTCSSNHDDDDDDELQCGWKTLQDMKTLL